MSNNISDTVDNIVSGDINKISRFVLKLALSGFVVDYDKECKRIYSKFLEYGDNKEDFPATIDQMENLLKTEAAFDLESEYKLVAQAYLFGYFNKELAKSHIFKRVRDFAKASEHELYNQYAEGLIDCRQLCTEFFSRLAEVIDHKKVEKP